MATITGPLVSLRARGTIGKTATFSSWRGVGYVRTRVVPANPRTTNQVSQRTLFSWLMSAWKQGASQLQESWTFFAKGMPFTDRNAWAKQNVLAIGYAATDNLALVFSSGAGGGLPPASATFTAGANSITIVPTIPAVPNGWSLMTAYAAVMLKENPQVLPATPIIGGDNAVSPYHIVFSGLTTAAEYVCGVWLIWQKPNSDFAYSVAVTGTATPT